MKNPNQNSNQQPRKKGRWMVTLAIFCQVLIRQIRSSCTDGCETCSDFDDPSFHPVLGPLSPFTTNTQICTSCPFEYGGIRNMGTSGGSCSTIPLNEPTKTQLETNCSTLIPGCNFCDKQRINSYESDYAASKCLQCTHPKIPSSDGTLCITPPIQCGDFKRCTNCSKNWAGKLICITCSYGFKMYPPMGCLPNKDERYPTCSTDIPNCQYCVLLGDLPATNPYTCSRLPPIISGKPGSPICLYCKTGLIPSQDRYTCIPDPDLQKTCQSIFPGCKVCSHDILTTDKVNRTSASSKSTCLACSPGYVFLNTFIDKNYDKNFGKQICLKKSTAPCRIKNCYKCGGLKTTYGGEEQICKVCFPGYIKAAQARLCNTAFFYRPMVVTFGTIKNCLVFDGYYLRATNTVNRYCVRCLPDFHLKDKLTCVPASEAETIPVTNYWCGLNIPNCNKCEIRKVAYPLPSYITCTACKPGYVYFDEICQLDLSQWDNSQFYIPHCIEINFNRYHWTYLTQNYVDIICKFCGKGYIPAVGGKSCVESPKTLPIPQTCASLSKCLVSICTWTDADEIACVDCQFEAGYPKSFILASADETNCFVKGVSTTVPQGDKIVNCRPEDKYSLFTGNGVICLFCEEGRHPGDDLKSCGDILVSKVPYCSLFSSCENCSFNDFQSMTNIHDSLDPSGSLPNQDFYKSVGCSSCEADEVNLLKGGGCYPTTDFPSLVTRLCSYFYGDLCAECEGDPSKWDGVFPVCKTCPSGTSFKTYVQFDEYKVTKFITGCNVDEMVNGVLCSFEGCAVCRSESLFNGTFDNILGCIKCMRGYNLVGTICVLLPPTQEGCEAAIPNCEECFDLSTHNFPSISSTLLPTKLVFGGDKHICKKCKTGFVRNDSNTGCLPVPAVVQITNCATAASPCYRCQDGFFPNNDGTACEGTITNPSTYPCYISNCIFCTVEESFNTELSRMVFLDPVCTICQHSYILTQDQSECVPSDASTYRAPEFSTGCVRDSENDSLNILVLCERCLTGFTMIEGHCVYSGSGHNCFEIFQDELCEECDFQRIHIPNIGTIGRYAFCTKCKAGYTPSNKRKLGEACKPDSSDLLDCADPNCKVCWKLLSDPECLICNKDYLLNSSRVCELIPADLVNSASGCYVTGCKTCKSDDKTTCEVCELGTIPVDQGKACLRRKEVSRFPQNYCLLPYFEYNLLGFPRAITCQECPLLLQNRNIITSCVNELNSRPVNPVPKCLKLVSRIVFSGKYKVDECVQCEPGYKLTDDLRHCLPIIGTGLTECRELNCQTCSFGFSPVVNTCTVCKETNLYSGCALKCSSITNCTACELNNREDKLLCTSCTAPSVPYLDGTCGLKCTGDPKYDSCAECTAAECTQCRPGYFLTDSSLCILQPYCNESTGPTTDGTSCGSCSDINCLGCPQSLDSCIRCTSSTFLKDASCLLTLEVPPLVCPEGQYADSTQTTCITCTTGCSTCHLIGSFVACDTCELDYFHNLKVCERSSCPISSDFLNAQGTCAPCATPCKTCVCEDDKCTSCEETTHELLPSTQECLLLCTGKKYRALTALVNPQTCLNCPNHCSTCKEFTGFANGYCTACDATYWLNPTSRVCELIPTCSSGKALTTATNTCDPCQNGPGPGPCVTCTTDTHSECTSCDETSYTLLVKGCWDICTSRQYRDSDKACQDCPPGCKTCTSDTVCTACDLSHEEETDGTEFCKLTCTTGQRRVNRQTCENCTMHDCDACTTTKSTCTSCATGHEKVNNAALCKTPCVTTKEYRDSTDNYDCKNCDTTCLTCDAGANTDCLSCNTSIYDDFSIGDRQCLTKCDSNQYRDNNKVCQDCPPGCKTCTSGTVCTACDSTHKPEIDGTQFCRRTCITGQRRVDRQTCEDCSMDNCDECTDIKTTCTTCSSGHEKVNNSALCKTPCVTTKEYREPTSSYDCKDCETTCLTCDGGTRTDCLSCTTSIYDDFSLTVKQCLVKCIDKQYRDNNRVCQNCYDGCLECHAVEETNTSYCDNCDLPNHWYDVKKDGVCVDCNINGGEFLFEHERTTECRTCHQSCASCSGFYSCNTCKQGLTKNEKGNCVEEKPATSKTQCKPGIEVFFENKCIGCHPSCQTCKGLGRFRCQACDTNNKFELNKGRCECQKGTYKNKEGACLSCYEPNCGKCFGPHSNQCYICKNKGYVLNKDTGVCWNCSQNPNKDQKVEFLKICKILPVPYAVKSQPKPTAHRERILYWMTGYIKPPTYSYSSKKYNINLIGREITDESRLKGPISQQVMRDLLKVSIKSLTEGKDYSLTYIYDSVVKTIEFKIRFFQDVGMVEMTVKTRDPGALISNPVYDADDLRKDVSNIPITKQLLINEKTEEQEEIERLELLKKHGITFIPDSLTTRVLQAQEKITLEQLTITKMIEGRATPTQKQKDLAKTLGKIVFWALVILVILAIMMSLTSLIQQAKFYGYLFQFMGTVSFLGRLNLINVSFGDLLLIFNQEVVQWNTIFMFDTTSEESLLPLIPPQKFTEYGVPLLTFNTIPIQIFAYIAISLLNSVLRKTLKPSKTKFTIMRFHLVTVCFLAYDVIFYGIFEVNSHCFWSNKTSFGQILSLITALFALFLIVLDIKRMVTETNSVNRKKKGKEEKKQSRENRMITKIDLEISQNGWKWSSFKNSVFVRFFNSMSILRFILIGYFVVILGNYSKSSAILILLCYLGFFIYFLTSIILFSKSSESKRYLYCRIFPELLYLLLSVLLVLLSFDPQNNKYSSTTTNNIQFTIMMISLILLITEFVFLVVKFIHALQEAKENQKMEKYQVKQHTRVVLKNEATSNEPLKKGMKPSKKQQNRDNILNREDNALIQSRKRRTVKILSQEEF